MMTSPDALMVICLPSIVMSPFFCMVIVAEPVFSTISSPAEIAIVLPTSSVSLSPTLVERSLPIDVVSLSPISIDWSSPTLIDREAPTEIVRAAPTVSAPGGSMASPRWRLSGCSSRKGERRGPVEIAVSLATAVPQLRLLPNAKGGQPKQWVVGQFDCGDEISS
jgi:hypothetical protein